MQPEAHGFLVDPHRGSRRFFGVPVMLDQSLSGSHGAIYTKRRLGLQEKVQTSFGHTNMVRGQIIAPMAAFDKIAIGKRITARRAKFGMDTPASLAAALLRRSKKKGDTKGISDETVRRWEKGLNLPDWGKLEQLLEVLELSAEELLFGEKRREQIASETPRLTYVASVESEMLQLFRHTDHDGQRTMLEMVRAIQKSHPRPMADVHALIRNSPTK